MDVTTRAQLLRDICDFCTQNKIDADPWDVVDAARAIVAEYSPGDDVNQLLHMYFADIDYLIDANI